MWAQLNLRGGGIQAFYNYIHQIHQNKLQPDGITKAAIQQEIMVLQLEENSVNCSTLRARRPVYAAGRADPADGEVIGAWMLFIEQK